MTALFDMDGTLFAGDSQLRFARRVLRRHGWRRLYLLLVVPGLILRGLRLVSLSWAKRLFLSYAWGMRREDLLAECRDFVQHELLPAMYPEVLAELRRHQAAGDTTVLCSASPEWWASIVGEQLGFTHTIGTPVELPERVPLLPHIPPPGNNRSAAKLTRLATLGITSADIAYTDSAADLPMLSIAQRAFLVNPSPTLAARFPQAHILRTPRSLPHLFTLRCILGL